MTTRSTRIRSLRAASIAAIWLLLIVAASAGAAAESADDEARLDEPALSGRVFTWNAGVLRVIEGASVSTGIVELQTDANGRFEFTPEQRSGSLSVVKPGFDVVRRTIYGDSIGIILRELVVRAVYVPFGESAKPQVQAWIRSLIERDLINAVVMDVKSEGGQVLSFASTPTADRIGATRWDDGSRAFFEELGEKGVYRIGRVVTFLDDRYSAWHPRTALQHVDGERFFDGAGLGWSSPFDAAARRYNVEIGVAAAECVDEVQFDYVRLPYESGLVERFKHGAEARAAAINTFAAEAAEALHLAGAAISFDVFGVIAISSGDEGIGQILAELSAHLDYVSPMLYPSGWGKGSFGLNYPPADPGLVIRHSMDATLARLAPGSHAEVRPWLQDFSDYQERRLGYTEELVTQQIIETARTGGYGFMLWDPSLEYQNGSLELAESLLWSPRYGAAGN